MGKQFFGAETPVGKDGDFELADGRALYTDMGVAPGSMVDAVAVAAGYVHATGVACVSIDDNDLTVCAAVDVAGEHGGDEFLEGLDFYTAASHVFIVVVAHKEVCPTVEHEPHVYALLCFANEQTA